MQKKRIVKAFIILGIILIALMGMLAVMAASKKLNINKYLVSPDSIKGIDVSHYQGEIDWKEIKKQNVSFAFIKATEGSNHVDETFAYNWENADKEGVATGAYHFFSFDSPAESQAELYMRTVGNLDGRLMPVIDVEYYGNKEADPPAVDTVVSQLQQLLDLLEQEYKVKPILYTTYKVYNRYLKDSFQDYPLWIRNVYYPPNDIGRQWDFWQYSDTGKLSGMNGVESYVDLNVFWGKQNDLEKYKIR